MPIAYSFLEAGTPVIWTSSGGNKVLNCASLANLAARQGDKSGSWLDGTKGLPEYIEFLMTFQYAVAPTDGGNISLYVGESDSAVAGTANPGNLTGADGTLAVGELALLDLVDICPLANAFSTNPRSRRSRYQPTCLYLSPVIYNAGGQALNSTGTNFVLTATPYYRRISY